jgi:cytochrome c-type biogenesis protein CcmH
MNTFLVIAAVMAAIAAGAVALPLLRDRQHRIQAALATVLVMGAAAGLYPLWSNWDWHAAVPTNPAAGAAGGPDVAAMVAKLEQHLRDQPDDLKGWLMLGRSYLVMDRYADAVTAYEHAHRLDGQNPDAAMGLGESMSLRAGGEITPEAAQLFEQALALAPADPKALLYGGFAAATRGDRALARTRWETLKGMHPPAQIEQMLDARIAELGSPPATTASSASSGTNASPAGTSTSVGGLGAAEVTVKINLAPALKSRLLSEVPLFVFAREPGVSGPPLAAKRLTSAAIGSQVQLSSADSMLPGRVLKSGQRVSITVRVSFGGQPTPSAGDLYGELSYEVGRDGVRDLLIDRIAQ